MTGLWLSRARLRRDTASVGALSRLLVPDDDGPRTAAAHRLVWALFADDPDRRRDFLWREEGPGRFMTLSARQPLPVPGLFDIDSTAFAPELAPGDRLGFTLRANPVVSRIKAPGERGKRQDVVMDALYAVPQGERASVRFTVATEAGLAWLARQGTAYGFAPGEVAVDGYETMRLPREQAKPIRFSQIEFTGVLTVTNPTAFLAALATGFGRARAFGCGLMLIRRA